MVPGIDEALMTTTVDRHDSQEDRGTSTAHGRSPTHLNLLSRFFIADETCCPNASFAQRR